MLVSSQHDLIEAAGRMLALQKKIVVTAESCTGGLLAAAITSRAGASCLFERGFVTYSNDAKMEELGIPQEILDQYGAVSIQCAHAMAEGALKNSRAHIAIAVTGIAGPGGGSEDKPVGLIYIGYADQQGYTHVDRHYFTGDRDTIRSQTVTQALTGLITLLNRI